jgi:hypothetical protein
MPAAKKFAAAEGGCRHVIFGNGNGGPGEAPGPTG